jgi:hypothetical protein
MCQGMCRGQCHLMRVSGDASLELGRRLAVAPALGPREELTATLSLSRSPKDPFCSAKVPLPTQDG